MRKLLVGWSFLVVIGACNFVCAQNTNEAIDPLQARSVAVKIVASSSGGSGGYELHWNASPEWVYHLETAKEFGGDWSVVERVEGRDSVTVLTQPIDVSVASARFFRVIAYPLPSPTVEPLGDSFHIRDYLPSSQSNPIELFNEFEPKESFVFYESESGKYHFDSRWEGNLGWRGLFALGGSGFTHQGWSSFADVDDTELTHLLYNEPLGLFPSEFKLGESQRATGTYRDVFFDFESQRPVESLYKDWIEVEFVGVESVALVDGEVSAVRIDITWDTEVFDLRTRNKLNAGEEWLWRLVESWWLAKGQGLVKVQLERFSPEGESWITQYLASSTSADNRPPNNGEGGGEEVPEYSPEPVEFRNLVVGKQLFEYRMLSESRFGWEGEGGNWSYVKTGPSTAVLEFTYDDDSNDRSVYREHVELRFEDTRSGTFFYSEWSAGEKTSSLDGTFSLSGLAAIPGFGDVLPPGGGESEGDAPTRERFNSLIVGKQFFDFAMVSATRFIWEGEGGEWTYDRTGPSTGRLILTYDEDGNNRSIYYEQVDLNFRDSVSGSFVYTEWSNQTKDRSLEGPFNLEGLPALP